MHHRLCLVTAGHTAGSAHCCRGDAPKQTNLLMNPFVPFQIGVVLVPTLRQFKPNIDNLMAVQKFILRRTRLNISLHWGSSETEKEAFHVWGWAFGCQHCNRWFTLHTEHSNFPEDNYNTICFLCIHRPLFIEICENNIFEGWRKLKYWGYWSKHFDLYL